MHKDAEGPATPALRPRTSWTQPSLIRLCYSGTVNLAFSVLREPGRKENRSQLSLSGLNSDQEHGPAILWGGQETSCLHSTWEQTQEAILGSPLVPWRLAPGPGTSALAAGVGELQWPVSAMEPFSQGLINGEELYPGSLGALSPAGCCLGPPNEATCLFGWCRVTYYQLIKNDSAAEAAGDTWREALTSTGLKAQPSQWAGFSQKSCWAHPVTHHIEFFQAHGPCLTPTTGTLTPFNWHFYKAQVCSTEWQKFCDYSVLKDQFSAWHSGAGSWWNHLYFKDEHCPHPHVGLCV